MHIPRPGVNYECFHVGITLISLCLCGQRWTGWTISPALTFPSYWLLLAPLLSYHLLCQHQCHLVRKSLLMLPPDKQLCNLPQMLWPWTHHSLLTESCQGLQAGFWWLAGYSDTGHLKSKQRSVIYRENKLRIHCGSDSKRGTHAAAQRIKGKKEEEKGFLSDFP